MVELCTLFTDGMMKVCMNFIKVVTTKVRNSYQVQ